MVLESQIREKLLGYAVRMISFDDFLEWFVPVSCGIEQNGDCDAKDLAHHIDGILAEASSAGWSPEDIHAELSRPFVVSPFAENVVGDPSPFPVSRSSATSSAINVVAVAA
jgi:hypothetical protein